MKCIVFVLGVLVAIVSSRLSVTKEDLRDARRLRTLFRQFRAESGVGNHGNLAEENLRFRIFKQSAEFVISQNQVRPWKSGLNKFSVMTSAEKKKYLGVNMTATLEAEVEVSYEGAPGSDYVYPKEKMWLGSVFDPIDQGKLKRFSKQQMLDCVFAWRNDGGCAGGANYVTYNYLQKGHPLIREQDYPPYQPKEGECREERYRDALIGAKVVGYTYTHPSEEGLLVALSRGVTAVSFEVTAAFYAYESGIIMDETCHGSITTHAVTAVGYSPAYILVKNSWGRDWGEDGFVKFARRHHACLLHTKPIYPVLELTGKRDADAAERPTTFRATSEAVVEPPACEDEYPAFMCGSSKCRSSWAIHCYKSCKRCSFDKDTCPRGKSMCSDATCKTAC